jgi:hypothetical protein
MNFGAFDSLAPRLSLPRVVKGYCGPDDCGFPWHPRACRELILYAADSASAPVVGKVAAGDTFTVELSNFHILVPAKIFFPTDYAITEKYDIDGPHGPRPDTVRFAAGDTLYVFEQSQEFYAWWYRGMLGHGVGFWDSSISDAHEVSPQRAVYWYQVKRSNQLVGWWKQGGKEVASGGVVCDFKKGEVAG